MSSQGDIKGWELDLPDEAASTRFAARIGTALRPGDTVLLTGTLGAGKSHMARSMIRARLDAPDMAVPSPTYTLVNVYSDPAGCEIWHADLYRAGGSEDLYELGLDDATTHAILLVEWPERWSDAPQRHLSLSLEITGDHSRHATLQPHGEGWGHVTKVLETITP